MTYKTLSRFSLGVGDRFAHQARAQLRAVMLAAEQGVEITPVWNKSFREHQIIGSRAESTRNQANRAVRELNWRGAWFVDADHINLANVDFFMDSCDFFTIDVADYIGRAAQAADIESFVKANERFAGAQNLPGTDVRLDLSREAIAGIGRKYLFAAQQAAQIYRHIAERKGAGNFIVEVSMDETDQPQQPLELLLILSALASLGVPVQTIAPKFSGRFNKGVDYVGDLWRFEQEFEMDVAALRLAVREFGLPEELKLSVHSGSDKFSLYPLIKKIIRRQEAGLHLKTAGTTWLEELIGLAEAGGSALELVREIYRRSLEKREELCAPYASVIQIDRAKLPSAAEVKTWDGRTFAATLRHNQQDARYNPHFRQLLHVGYKIAAHMGNEYLAALEQNEEVISHHVTANIFERHIRPLFLG